MSGKCDTWESRQLYKNFGGKSVNNVHEHLTSISYPLIDFTDIDRGRLRLLKSV
jgi:hypothetical protein